MKEWRRFLNRFTVFELIIIAMMAALGVATKPIVVPLSHIITGPLFIPGGAVAGGFYMLWIVLGAGLVGKRGTATLIGLVQALMVMVTGIFGSHGALTIVSYTLPGLMVDLGLALIRHRVCCAPCAFLAGVLANMSGTAVVNLIFFRLPFVPLMLSLSAAALAGGLGGLIAYKILQQLRKHRIGQMQI